MSRFNKKQLAIFLVVFALAGLVIYKTFAAGSLTAKAEAEKMTFNSSVAAVVTDRKASGGQALQFIQNGSATASVSLSGSTNNLNVLAHATKCKGGGWPTITVSLDSKDIFTTGVNSTRWKALSYAMTSSIPAGAHQLTVTASDVDTIRNCTRSIYLDAVEFYGDSGSTTPAPTVSLTANPASITSGASSTLSWSSTNSSSCNASGGWSGTKATSGSENTGALTASATYSLSCTGAGGTANASATVTVGAPQIPAAPTIYLNPLTKSYAQGTTFTVELREDSGSQLVNAVQANLSYPADKLDFVSIDASGSAFSTEAESTGGSGQIKIARGSTTARSGNQLIAKITFKTRAVLATASVSFTTGTQLVSSATNQNLLSSLSATGGGSYTIQ